MKCTITAHNVPCQYPFVLWQIYNLSRFPNVPAMCLCRDQSDPSKKSDRETTPCIFNWSPIVGHPLVSIDCPRVSRVRWDYCSSTFCDLKTSLRSNTFRICADDIQCEIFQHLTINRKNLYVRVNMCKAQILIIRIWKWELKMQKIQGPSNGKIHLTTLAHLIFWIFLQIINVFFLILLFW